MSLIAETAADEVALMREIASSWTTVNMIAGLPTSKTRSGVKYLQLCTLKETVFGCGCAFSRPYPLRV